MEVEGEEMRIRTSDEMIPVDRRMKNMLPTFDETMQYEVDPKFISIIEEYCRNCNFNGNKQSKIPTPLPTNKVEQIQAEWMDSHEKEFLKKYLGQPG